LIERRAIYFCKFLRETNLQDVKQKIIKIRKGGRRDGRN
jgi:hypothetical protein